ESGEYRVWGVPAGKYVLVARCGRLPFQPRPLSSGPPAPPTLAYVPSYYPDVPERSAAQVVELHAGDERTGLDFRLTTARVYTVSGVLTAPAGQSLQHMMVEMVKRSDVNPFDRRGGRRVNPATGEFSVDGVFPGSYELVAASHNPNLLEPPLGARQGAEVTDRPLKVNLTLVTGKDITGTLSVDTDRPYDHKQLTLHLMPVDPGRMAGGPAPVQPDAAGNFVLKGVLPGRWRLAVHGGPEVFVRSIDFAGRTVDGEIEIASGSAGPLRLVLSTRGATLEGTGTPGRQYLVMEADLDRRFNIPRTVLADAQGRIFIPSLPPGKYRIYEGRVPLPDTPYREITATEGGKVTVELKAAN
ncbi:MAG TPA: hypothetical protein VES20_24635, partial [Bryobacteraceae bacterium]|nr:hypothetical protein [Bryobacteraceae bacterium]